MNARHVPYHPKWHRARMPIFWWLEKLSYVKFISRELTSIGVLYASLLLLIELWTLSRGGSERFVRFLESPVGLVIHVLLLSSLLFHTITWLNLAPKAMVLRVGSRRLPDRAVLAGHYLAWLVATAFLIGYLVR